jgi:geranylgeranyl pyrophosphate synthase
MESIMITSEQEGGDSQPSNFFKENVSSERLVNEDAYQKAQHKAAWYLRQLNQLTQSPETINTLHQDYKHWHRKHSLKSLMGLSQLEAQHDERQIDSLSYLEKIATEKKLKTYLSKSFSYIFLRDLGKSLGDQQTQDKIKGLVDKFDTHIHNRIYNKPANSGRLTQEEESMFNLGFVHQKALEYKLEKTLYWLMQKLHQVQSSLPDSLDKTNGMRKLVKIIAGVVMHQFVDLPSDASVVEKRRLLDSAIRLGYCYGLTYPLIDDLQDSDQTLTPEDKQLFNQAIRQSLLQGEVSACPKFSDESQDFMLFVYDELGEAFNTIRQYHTPVAAKAFFEQAFVFFEAQDIDRQRKNNQLYSMEDLFTPIILKAAGCRMVAKEIVAHKPDNAFDHRTFCFGIYNQFNDDIKDIFDDQLESNVTPYTYYLKNQKLKKPNLENKNSENRHSKPLQNPYQIYWSVVNYLIYNVFEGDETSKQLLLERSINAHKSLRQQIGAARYQELRQQMLFTDNKEFDQLIDKLVVQPNDIAWFDKLLSRQIADFFSQSQSKQSQFQHDYEQSRQFVEENIEIKEQHRIHPSPLVDAANYSLRAGGKRLRPVLAHWMSCEKYGFTDKESIPVLRLLEYMHTASLIFDDLPSQDNADTRRAQPSLHKHLHSEAEAELTAVMMMMKAVEEQATISKVPASAVLESIRYSASTTQAITKGQWLDINSQNNHTSFEQLERICHLKTGLAIEAALMIPAILSQANDIELKHIQSFCYHLGLAFQIKDDLLDASSNLKTLGKPALQDVHKASFVTLLGIDKAYEKLYQHYFSCLELLPNFKPIDKKLQSIADFVIHRHN